MSEREQTIRDMGEFSARISRCYKEMENMLDSLKESLDKVIARFDKYFGKE